MRILKCIMCGDNSATTMHGRESPLGQLPRWPSIFLHSKCADELAIGLSNEVGATTDHVLIRRIYEDSYEQQS